VKSLGNASHAVLLSTLEYLEEGVAMTDVLDGSRDPDREVETCILLVREMIEAPKLKYWVLGGFFAGVAITVAALIVWAALS
jgi:hypothetical protein